MYLTSKYDFIFTVYNYIIIQNLYLYNYSDSVLTTRHRCISYFPGQAVREVTCGYKRSYNC